MNRFLIISLLIAQAIVARADDEAQTELRLNPEIEQSLVNESNINYNKYTFLRLKHNHISLNGDDWSSLGAKYAAALAGDTIFNVVYLGDSHVQADFGGAVLRQRLAHGHSAGRGIAIPFKLAGTNQPNDYSIGLSEDFTSSKLMRMPWCTDITFTGIGIHPTSNKHTLRMDTPEAATRVRFHTKGTCPDVISVNANGLDVEFTSTIDNDSLTTITIEHPATHFEITLTADKSTVYGAVEFMTSLKGIMTHSIGNNGATFSSYTMVDRFGAGLSTLHPDLVIIALGTNEAFGRTSTETISADVENLVRIINNNCPEAKVLLVGPTECYKRVYRRRKKRRRTATKVVNTRTADMARAIRLTAENLGVPYLNQYALAGRASEMSSAKILGKDGVHFTATGYRLWGNLLADAILEKINDSNCANVIETTDKSEI